MLNAGDYISAQSPLAKCKLAESLATEGAFDWYTALFRDAPVPVLLIDAATASIRDANPVAAEFYGYSVETLRGMTLADLDVRDGETVRAELANVTDCQGACFDVTHCRAEGDRREVRLQVSCIRSEKASIVYAAVHDMTDEIRMQRERRFLAAIIEETQDMAAIRDLDLRIISANRAFLQAVGASSLQEVVGKTDKELFAGRMAAAAIAARQAEERRVQNLFAEELIVSEETLLGPDGQTHTLLARKFPVFDESQQLIGTACIAHDITEQKVAEEKLRRSEMQARNFGMRLAKLHKLGNALSKVAGLDELCRRAVEEGRELLGFDRMSVWQYDSETGRITGTYGTDEQGQTRDERGCKWPQWQDHPIRHIIGKRVALLTSDRAELHDPRQLVGHGPRSLAGLWDGEEVVGFISADNLISQAPITGPQNEMLAQFAATIGHLLTQKKAEQELRHSEERMRMLLEHSHDGINIMRVDSQTGDFRLILCNDRYTKMAGRSREELLRRGNVWELIRAEEPEAMDEAWQRCVREGVPYTGRGSWIRPDGKENYFESAVARVILDGEVYTIGMDRDITEQVIAERERTHLEAQVQHAQKLESLGVLAGGIAHDFNNLLVAILGNADLALMDLNPTAPATQSVQEVKKAALRASDLTNQMLAYSGRGTFVIEPLDINALVRQMAHLLEVSISKKTTLRFDLDEAIGRFQADASQIQQVVMNLITNAADAIGSDNGTVTLRTCLRELSRDELAGGYLDDDLPPGRYICLEVEDSGCGMTDEQVQRVFDPFYTTKFTGRGLGLAAVLGIVRGHNGAVQIDTTPGRGTMFRILLPAHDDRYIEADEELPPADQPVDTDSVVNWQGSGRVLLVDDQPAVRQVGRAMLTRLGFDVLEATDGSEAIEVYRDHAESITLVLLDMTMPNMDGPETFRQLQKINPEVPVLLCSGYSEQEAAEKTRMPKLAGFLHKPFHFEDLARKLRSMLTAEE